VAGIGQCVQLAVKPVIEQLAVALAHFSGDHHRIDVLRSGLQHDARDGLADGGDDASTAFERVEAARLSWLERMVTVARAVFLERF
jgi:hypothetical protein